MQRKVYFLSTCDTSRRIMKEVGVDDSFEQQDIKFNPVTEEQIEHFYRQTGSYEELINKRARNQRCRLQKTAVNGLYLPETPRL